MPAKCKARERIRDSGNADIPSLPVGAIRGYLCFRCFDHSESIMKCSACKRAGYCSKACQKLDWSIVHKKQCKILVAMNKLEEQQYQPSRTWSEYSQYLLKAVRTIREASPDDNLHFIVQAQPYCSSCRRSAIQLSSRNIALKPCKKCRLIFSCSECPATHSPSVCSEYQNHAKNEQFRIDYFEDTGRASPSAPTESPRTTYKPLADAEGWHDYYMNISDKRMIEGVIKRDFSGLTDKVHRLAPGNQHEDEERMRMFLLFVTDTLTMPLTILSALEDLSWKQSNLNIHLVGATSREFLALAIFEEILHLVPTIKNLDITAIGPSSWRNDDAQQTPFVSKMPLNCCVKCESAGRKRTIASYKGLYHDFEASAYYQKPDLVVLFNSGCADGDDADSDWDPTIRLLVDRGLPALFTTYNAEEARHEETKMKSLGAKFVVKPEKNKWSSLLPAPEFLDEEYGVWYTNSHRYIICGRDG